MTDTDVVEVLDMYEFKRSKNRSNVLSEENKLLGVYSDTLGLIRLRGGDLQASTKTAAAFDVLGLLSKSVWSNVDGAAFTSVTINKDFACARHRDSNNEGPSLVKAIGSFVGGELVYWKDDPRKIHVQKVRHADAVVCNVSNEFVPINGKSAHEVMPFQGSRYSIVFFTVEGYKGTPENVQQLLVKAGIPWPSDHLLADMLHMVGHYHSGMGKTQQDVACSVRQREQDSVAAPVPNVATCASVSPAARHNPTILAWTQRSHSM